MIWLSGRPLAALLFSERRGLEKTWTLALEIWKVCGCGDKLQFFLHLLALRGVQLLHSLDSGRSRLTVIEILLVHVDLLTLSQSCFKNVKVLSMFQVMLDFWLEETFEGHTVSITYGLFGEFFGKNATVRNNMHTCDAVGKLGLRLPIKYLYIGLCP